jgi:hypothetical protein
MKNSSQVIKREQCPRCASQGKDNSHNNLAVYSDGGKFCFSCNKATELSDTYKKEHGLTEIVIKNERTLRCRIMG